LVTLETGLPANRLTAGDEQALADAVARLREDPAVRVLILAAAGSDFCGGIEAGAADGDGSEAALEPPAAVEALAAFGRPTIAAIGGLASGRGLELALACDLRVADPTARFELPEVGLGTIPSGGGTQRLPRIVGKAHAFELIALGLPIAAGEAHRIGLVNRLAPAGGAIAEARRIAGVLITRGPLALRFAKEAIERGQDLTLDEGLRLEADLAFILMTTHDRAEGIQSFKEKRPPVYRGD
jgi:enoyl-CoA hydratase/carnithine racemase